MDNGPRAELTRGKDFRMVELRTVNGQEKLFVDGAPYLILAVQMNCDSCYSADTLEVLFQNAAKMGCNTVSVPFYWRRFEPEEGRYDTDFLESVLSRARKYALRVVLAWFGSYKNGALHYAPDWVLADTERFARVRRGDGTMAQFAACPNGAALLEKDSAAVCRIFAHLRDHDPEDTVILFQVNNETGILCRSARCHCDACETRFAAGAYENRYGNRADEIFAAESILAFQERIAKAAKAIKLIPCYLNAWLALPDADSKPGFTYPSGGPSEHVLERYLQLKECIDFVSPDIYTTGYRDFDRYCRMYRRAGNALFVAELGVGSHSRSEKNIYYAFGEHGAIGVDLWAIDSAFPDVLETPMCDFTNGRWNEEAYAVQASYLPLRDAMRPVAEALGTERLQYWVQEEGERTKTLDFSDVCIRIDYCNSGYGESRGIAVRLSEKSFLLLGVKSKATFFTPDGEPIAIHDSERGAYRGETFEPERRNTICWLEFPYRVLLKEPSVTRTVLA